jgi:arylsulfatase
MPNIILITTDQQRYDTLGCMGNPVIQTPNLDRLASRGTLHRRCYSVSPVCVSARTTLITGLAPGRLDPSRPEGVDNGTKMAPGTPTIPQMLADAGYHTQMIGKQHTWPMDEPYGFDHQILSEETRFTRFGKALFGEEGRDDYDTFLEERGLLGYDKPPEIGYNEIKPLVSPLRDEHHVTTWCANETIRFLDSAERRSDPFFLWCSFVKPHVPYDPPLGWHDRYDPDDLPPRITERGGTNPIYEHSVRNADWWQYSEEAWRLSRAYYYGVISHIDYHLGRVIAAIERNGLFDDTLIVFTSDHGDMIGDQGLWYKGLPYEGSMHIPLIVKPPSNQPGKVGSQCDDVVDHLDVCATIMAAAGLERSAEMPGNDLVAEHEPHEGVVGEFGSGAGRWVSWTDREWKFFHYLQGGYEELYNLADDPDETRNLIDTGEGRRQRVRIVPKITEWITRYANPVGILTPDGTELRVEDQKLRDIAAPGEKEGPFSRGIGAWPRVPKAYDE